MSMFSMSIKKKLMLVLLLPSLLSALLLLLDSKSNMEQIAKQNAVKQVTLLSEVLANVAHNFAVERGLSAGFLGSKGKSGEEKLAKHRLKADAAAQNLLVNMEKLKEIMVNEYSLTLINNLSMQLSARGEMRGKIDLLEGKGEFFNYYSTINRMHFN